MNRMKSGRKSRSTIPKLRWIAAAAVVLVVSLLVFRNPTDPDVFSLGYQVKANFAGNTFLRMAEQFDDVLQQLQRAAKSFFMLLDVRSGQRTPLTALESLIKRNSSMLDGDPVVNWELSADGSRVIWTNESLATGRSQTIGVHLARIDGSEHMFWPWKSKDGVFSAHWLSNDRWIADTDYSPSGQAAHAITATNDGTSRVHRFSIGRLEADYLSSPDATTSVPPSNQFDILTAESQASSYRLAVQRHHMTAPRGTECYTADVDRSGKRVVWLLRSQPAMPSWRTWLSRVFNMPAPKAEPRLEFWVSNIDGGQMRRIGFVPIQATDGHSSRTRTFYMLTGTPAPPVVPGEDLDVVAIKAADKLRWLPDGKHISFVHYATLWVVPVD